MIVISERKLTEEEKELYTKNHYRVYYTWEGNIPQIKYGEAVGFLMKAYCTSTIKLIEKLIYRKTKSNITAKLENGECIIIDKENWKSTYYNDKTRNWYSIKNKVLEIYDEQREIRSKKMQDYKKRKLTEELEEQIGDIPEDLDRFVKVFAPLYTVDYDPEDTLSKLRAYQQCKYYLDNDFEYTRDPFGMLPTEEKMFECVSFGNEEYMNDTCFKRTRRNKKYYA